MRKAYLIALFIAAVSVSGCYTKAYVQAVRAQQMQQSQVNANQTVQANNNK